MNKSEHIYKVAFKEHIPGAPSDWESKDVYFGSLTAIYDVFTPEQIGCKVENLWKVGFPEGKSYENRICRITREPIIRSGKRRLNKAE